MHYVRNSQIKISFFAYSEMSNYYSPYIESFNFKLFINYNRKV